MLVSCRQVGQQQRAVLNQVVLCAIERRAVQHSRRSSNGPASSNMLARLFEIQSQMRLLQRSRQVGAWLLPGAGAVVVLLLLPASYLEVSVDDPVLVQVRQPVQQLPHEALHHVGVNGACSSTQHKTQAACNLCGGCSWFICYSHEVRQLAAAAAAASWHVQGCAR